MLQTLAIIGATCVVSFLAFNDQRLFDRLLLWPPAVARERQVERLLTYGFVHADGMHLLFNMITLYFFGQVMEKLYFVLAGPIGFVVFYLGAIVASILPSYLRHRSDSTYRSVGASGGVSAVLFAFILVQPWTTIYIFFFPVPAILYAVIYVAYSIYMDRRQDQAINHLAHLVGAAYGVAVTLALEPRLFGYFINQLFHR
jgi:membrane associated rhomboid family serine protease